MEIFMTSYLPIINRIFIYCVVSFSFCYPTFALANGPLIGVHLAETATTEEYQQGLNAAASLNFKVIRIPVDWNALSEAGANHYSSDYVNEIIARVIHAQSLGQKVVMMMSQSPAWASGNTGENGPSYPPKSNYYQDYANAMSYVHSELINSSKILTDTILAWEVWNEPNVLEFWRPDDKGEVDSRPDTFVLIPLEAADEYAALLGITYDTMKQAYPDLAILGGSIASADTAYLQRMYQFWGGRQNAKFDHLSLHPYSRANEDDGGKPLAPAVCDGSTWCFKHGIEAIRGTLNNDKEIWFTEFGVSSGTSWGEAGSEAAQAKYMQDALDILKTWEEDNNAMNIRVALIYRLRDGSDLFGLFDNQLNEKQIATETKLRVDNEGRLITEALNEAGTGAFDWLLLLGFLGLITLRMRNRSDEIY